MNKTATVKKNLIVINKIDFAAKNLTLNAGLFLLFEVCMKIASPKKTVSNIPVLASVCFMRSVYLTQHPASQEIMHKNHGNLDTENAIMLEVSPKFFAS
jgi:hypothetical protein